MAVAAQQRQIVGGFVTDMAIVEVMHVVGMAAAVFATGRATLPIDESCPVADSGPGKTAI
jgi:hypothetical protein